MVDLLITARIKTSVTMKQLSATLPEVTAAYKELTAAQKERLTNGKKLTDAQNLLATYERDLESLNQWVDSDKEKYSAVKGEIGNLAAETRTKLEGCTSAAGMTKVLNDYSAGVARLLLEKLNFTAGKTTLGELNKLSQVIEQASAAIIGLTKEQKELLDEAQVASCAAAKELLAVYTKAAESLNKWSSEDQSKYTDLNTALNSLAATARKELEASVDNLRNMQRICGGDSDGKIHLLLDYTDHPSDVADPWYTGDFEATWQDVLAGCQGLLKELSQKRGEQDGTK